VGKPAAELSDAPRGVVDEWGHVSTAECALVRVRVRVRVGEVGLGATPPPPSAPSGALTLA